MRSTKLRESARRQRDWRDRGASASCRSDLVGVGRECDQLRLSCPADVAVVESADLGQGDDGSLRRWLDCARLRRVLLESEMRARRVVVAEIIAKTATQVSLVYNNHVIEELAADRTDQALGKGILPGRARCRENLADAEALDTSPKLAAVDAVAITEEKARGFFMREGFDDLLRGPGGGG